MDDNSLIWFQTAFASGFVVPVLILLVVICFVVFIHEMGHFLTARLFGVRVRKFSIGFGRELAGFTDKSGMRWSLSLWPLGGYVELFGYDSAPEPTLWDPILSGRRAYTAEEKKVAFCFKPLWQRILIVAMGPAANFIFAILVLIVLYSSYGVYASRPEINAVGLDSAAFNAGFKPGDKILEMDGASVQRFEEIWSQSFVSTEPMVWTILRNNKVLKISVIPEVINYEDGKGIERSHGRIGALPTQTIKFDKIFSVDGIDVQNNAEKARALLNERLDQTVLLEIEIFYGQNDKFITFPSSKANPDLMKSGEDAPDKVVIGDQTEPYLVKLPIFEAAKLSLERMYKFIDESLKFLHAAFFKNSGDEKIGGLVTMGKITSDAVEAGWYSLIMLVVIFSVQIGFINLMPIPVLDGGYLTFFFYEAITGKPLPAKVQDYSLSLGLVLLIGIMLWANISDILNLGG